SQGVRQEPGPERGATGCREEDFGTTAAGDPAHPARHLHFGRRSDRAFSRPSRPYDRANTHCTQRRAKEEVRSACSTQSYTRAGPEERRGLAQSHYTAVGVPQVVVSHVRRFAVWPLNSLADGVKPDLTQRRGTKHETQRYKSGVNNSPRADSSGLPCSRIFR